MVAEVRAPISDATVVRVTPAKGAGPRNIFRVSTLRELKDRIDHMGFEDNDPLSVGRGNITLILAWIDRLNGKEGE